MTLIMWGIYPHEGIEVYTDTQMTTTSGEVVGETNKYFVTPANVVIAGTGGADTIEAWQSLSATTQLDFDQFVLEAEQQLPSIHDSIVGNAGIASTVFHFGWSSAHGQFAGAVQSSKEGFAPEFRLRPGLGVRPNVKNPFAPETDAGFVALARQIQAEQNMLTDGDPNKVPIGGHLMMIDITPAGAHERNLGPI